MVEVDRGGHRLDEPLLARAVLGDVLVVVAQRDAGARREPLDRVDEVEVLDLAHERDRVAARLATEAYEPPISGLMLNDGDLLGVERAQADEAAPDALEREVLAGQRDEIGGVADPRHVLVEDAHRAML